MRLCPPKEWVDARYYVFKRNPWLKINPAKAKTQCVFARTPPWTEGRAEMPMQVRAMAGIFRWAADQLDEISVDARTDVLGMYMRYMKEWLERNRHPTEEALISAMRENLLNAIKDFFRLKLGRELPTDSLEDAIKELRSEKPKKVVKKLPADTLKAVAEIVRV